MLINGIQSNTIDASDRGLAYGDGLFSTIKVESGLVCLWDFHLQRLQFGAKQLFFPEINWSLLTSEVFALGAKLADKKQAVIKVILTRGSGGRGYSVQGCDSPVRILSDFNLPEIYNEWQEQGIDIVHCSQTLSSNKQLAGLKTLNRLEQVLIKHELEKKQAVEGIVCDNQGVVIEACSANIFVYLNDKWITPKLDFCGVAGVKRRQIMENAEKVGILIAEVRLKVEDLFVAEALFLTNALMGIVPVRRYQDKLYGQSALLIIQNLTSQLNLQQGVA